MESSFCAVSMNGATKMSNDYIAVLSYGEGRHDIYYETDVLTIGIALKMLAKAYVREIQKLNKDDREAVEQLLGEAFNG